MNILSFLSAANAPKDLWTILFNWVQGAIGNYGWTILLVTILVKLVMSPIDFMVKYQTKKQTLVQKKCSPQIAKLQKKFGANQEQLRIQTNALYKREGLNMGTGCLIMLVNMILTMVVFFTFFGSLRKVSAYELINQYETIEQSYEPAFKTAAINYSETDDITEATYDTWLKNYQDAKAIVESPDANRETEEYKAQNTIYETANVVATHANSEALKACLNTWNEQKDNWLWVQNIWVADATTTALPTYDGLVSSAKNGGYDTYVKENIDKTSYTQISAYISENGERKNNGFYILPIIVALTTFLSQLINDLHTKLKNKKAQHLAKASDTTNGSAMKIMKIIMPLIMLGFALTSSTSFGIYLFASSIATIAFGEVINLIINKLTKTKQQEVEEVLAKEAERMIKKGKLQG